MDAFVSDFLYAFRVFFKRPGLTLLAILALAVSIGMSTAAFSILNGIFFKQPPFKDPDQLYQVHLRNTKAGHNALPLPLDKFDTIADITGFKVISSHLTGTINISGNGLPRRYNGGFVSPNFLELLGEHPLIGGGFSPAPPAAGDPGELLIGYGMWQDQFRGDPDIIGTPVTANGLPCVIVGVMPEGFQFPLNGDVWMPIHPGEEQEGSSHLKYAYALGRLDPGADIEQINAGLAASFSEWSKESVEAKDDLVLVAQPFSKVPMNNASSSLVAAAVGAVIFILLVSCANVANLLVGRALTRGREMAIRSAIGATRCRIIRQLLTESLLLSSFGALGGVLCAAWAVDATMQSSFYDLPFWMSFDLDWRVFLFVIVVMLLTALVSGLVPAWQASKVDLNEMLKETAHTSTSFRLGRVTRLLAVVQVAFSCALLFGAGLITRHVYQIAKVDPGYPREELLTMRMGLFPARYPEQADRQAFFEALTAKTARIPGVEAAAVTSWISMFGNYKEPYLLAAGPGGQPEITYAYTESVSPEYFTTFGLELLHGRAFDARDSQSSEPVAVVNQAFARAVFGDEDPLGKVIQPFMSSTLKPLEKTPRLERIIGVVADARVSNFSEVDVSEPIIYNLYTQTDSSFMTLVLRSRQAGADDLRKSVQKLVLEMDADLPVYFIKTMEDYINGQVYPYRVLSNYFLTIGLMALFLASVGVYGMLAFNVSRRCREIGIRMALGAGTIRIVTQILRQGFVQVSLGLLVGTGLAYLIGRIIRGFLFGINPADPSVYFGVLLTLIGVATIAFFVPARRAARLSPLEALRYE